MGARNLKDGFPVPNPTGCGTKPPNRRESIVEVNIYGRNIKVSERLHDYVEDKVQKFEKLGDNVSDIDVKFTKDGHLGGNVIRVSRSR